MSAYWKVSSFPPLRLSCQTQTLHFLRKRETERERQRERERERGREGKGGENPCD